MRKFTLSNLILSIFMLAAVAVTAQPCVPDLTITEPGLSPLPEDLPCNVKGEPYDIAIQFKNFDTVTVFGQTVTIEWIIIDSINNIPCGIGWESSKDTFYNSENGCIQVAGTNFNDPAGQYKLDIIVTAKIENFPVISGQNAETLGSSFRYDVRVKDLAADPCPPIDTNAVSMRSSCNGVAANIREVLNSVSEVSVSPNPFSERAEVKFKSSVQGDFEMTIVDMVGTEISREAINIVRGTNFYSIDGSELSKGVYFLNISDGVGQASKRFIVAE